MTHPTELEPAVPAVDLPAQPGRRGEALWSGPPVDLELVIGTQVITGANDQALVAERERQRRLFAFLYSTPAYRRTLELYGWEEMAPRLAAMVRSDDWDDLASVVTDEVLDTLVPTGTFEEIPGLLRDRFAALGQGILLAPPADPRDDAAFARSSRRCRNPEVASAQRGIGKMSSSAASVLDRGPALLLTHAGVALCGREHAWQQPEVPGRAEGVDAGRRQGEVDAAVDALVAGLRFVPRRGPALRRGGVAGHGVGQGRWSAHGRRADGLDHHDAHVALGAGGQELLGRLAILGRAHRAG